MDATMVDASTERASRREWLGLAVLALPSLLLSIDLSVVYLALPRLSEDLHAGSVQQLWIVDIYGFMTAGLLVTMGAVGDRIGRRRLLLIGSLGFAVSSAVAAYSTSAAMLIGARAAMGVAGSTIAPSALGLIGSMFRDSRQRGIGIAVWVSCFMGGAAGGPVIGGLLLARLWWGSVFLLAVPVMVLLLVAGPLLLPEHRAGATGRFDVISVPLSLVAILPVIFGIKQLARDGVGVIALLSIAVGLVFGVVFVARQRRLAEPLLDVRLFRIPAFTTAVVVLMLGVAGQGGVMLLVTQDLQLVRGFSPLRAGLWLVPSSLAMVVGALGAPLIARAVRRGTVVTLGLAIAAAGYLVLTFLPSAPGLALMVIGIVLVFFGIGLMSALSNDLIVGSVSPDRAGSAASIAQTSGDFGIAFGVAAVGSVGAAVYRHMMATNMPSGLPPDVRRSAGDTLAGAAAGAGQLPRQIGAVLLDQARSAFVDGLAIAAVAASILMVILAVLVGITFRRTDASNDSGAAGPAADGSE